MRHRRDSTRAPPLTYGWFRLGLDRIVESGREVARKRREKKGQEEDDPENDDEGKYEENYRNEVVRDRILRSMGLTYWDALTGYTPGTGGNLTAANIAESLGLYRSRRIDWFNRVRLPDLGKFVGTLVIVLRKEIVEVAFPVNHEVIRRARDSTMALIREEDCGLDYKEPTWQEFVCVRRLLDHPQADARIPPDRSEALDPAITHANLKTVRQYSRFCHKPVE